MKLNESTKKLKLINFVALCNRFSIATLRNRQSDLSPKTNLRLLWCPGTHERLKFVISQEFNELIMRHVGNLLSYI